MTNEQIIALVNKALQTSSGGLVNTQQLQSFIEEAVQTSDFLQEIRVETGIATKLDLDLIGVLPKMLRKKTELTALPPGDNIVPDKRSLTPITCGLHQPISYDWLERALGGEPGNFNPDVVSKLEEQIQAMLSKGHAADVVNLIWNGDTGSADLFFKIIDGILVKMDEDSAVHKEEYTAETKLEDAFDLAINMMPDKYVADLSRLRFYVNPWTRRMYKKEIRARETAMGDEAYKNNPIYHDDIMVKPVFAVPRNVIVLTYPENIALGYGRQMLVERDKNILKGEIDIVMTTAMDVNHVIGDAVVLLEAGDINPGFEHEAPSE